MMVELLVTILLAALAYWLALALTHVALIAIVAAIVVLIIGAGRSRY